MKWLDGKGVCLMPKVKGSNLVGGVMYGQQWYVDQIFLHRILRIGA